MTPLILAVGFLASCDTPQKRGLRELAKVGIEPSAKALVQAVSAQDSKRAGWLLDVGVYTEQRDADGRTPVRIAIENGDLPCVFKLLDARANVNAESPDRASILGIAVQRGETAIVEKLLAAGARTDGLMPDGEKILPWAIREGRLTFVRAMMKSGADPHLKDRSGNPLLHVAMEAGRRDIMEDLLTLGADAGATNAAGETTLVLAIRRSWNDMAPKLVAAGADPDAPGQDGSTLLERATEEKDFSRVSLLLRIGANPNRVRPGRNSTPIEQALASKDTRLLELFLDHVTKSAAVTRDRWLWKAYQNRNPAAARLLLRHGARAERPGPDGLLLVETAAAAGHGSFVKMLLDHGNPAGHALTRACLAADTGMVDLLLACGVNPNQTIYPTLDTPLTLSIRARRDEIAAMLIRQGADTRLRLPEGQPLLHLAIATGCHRTVKNLLDSGVDANAPFNLPVSPEFLKNVRPGILRWALKNERNVTPLMLAIDSGEIQTTRQLIRAGAKLQTYTRPNKFWPMNFATDRKDVKMMRLLLGKDPHREERQIVIKLSEQRAQLFDAAGNELFNTKVSTGRKGFSTPTGEFVITDKNRDWTSTIYHASMPYFQRLNCSDFGLHQGVVPGYPASHGCIRVPAGNAAKLFTMTQAGDRVKIIP